MRSATLAFILFATVAAAADPPPLVLALRTATPTAGFDALPGRLGELGNLAPRTGRELEAAARRILADVPHFDNQPDMYSVIAEDLARRLPEDTDRKLTDADRKRVREWFRELAAACKAEAGRKVAAGVLEEKR